MADDFVDYYELMQVSPHAELETIQRVFRLLASRYHPDNPETGDLAKFIGLNSAYEVLSNHETRAGYDLDWTLRRGEPMKVFELKEFASGIDGEANRRMGLLCLLYNRRRTDLQEPGLSILDLEALMAFPREHLLFTIWYLKEKNLATQDDKSSYVITAEGVDYVESHLPKHNVLYKLLKAAENGTAHSATLRADIFAEATSEN